MLLYLFYWLLAPILWILLFPACLFNTKIRHHWMNERKTWRSVEKKWKEQKNGKIVVLFHAASTGEFEQLKPILKKMDRKRFFIIQSFFSSTVFNIEKNTPLADTTCYHPFDFPWSAWRFFKRMNIQYYITSRNDIWPSHLYIANRMKIHSTLINANLYRKSHYESYLLRSFYKKIFSQFDLILTGSDRLKKNLMNLVPENKIYITGDSRLDRVLERKKCEKSDLLPSSFDESRNIIFGSIDTLDYPVLFSGIKKIYQNGQIDLEERDHRLIIVPHEIDTRSIKRIQDHLKQLGFDATRYTEKEKLENSRVLIIDVVGILADLYYYSDLAYVGAGFSTGVHSVLEPAIYANAISFGPKFNIVDMAVSLSDLRLAIVIHSGEDLSIFLNLLNDKKKLDEIRQNMQNYISNQPLASEKIIKTIFFK